MPWLNWPNRITITRILLVPPFVICMLNVNASWHGWRYSAMALFFLMAVSDALDGFLARRLGEATPLGRYLDPIGDKLLITSAVILLAIESTALPGYRLPSWVPVIAIGKDVLTVIGFALVYATTGQFFVQPRTLGKACTLVQLMMVAYALAAPDLPPLVQRAWPATWWVASAFAVVALADYVRVGNRFAAEQHAHTGG
ncbi:MAG: CDP-alcohol phosphatidyltransferase family protein [Planctomycetota bacterium]